MEKCIIDPRHTSLPPASEGASISVGFVYCVCVSCTCQEVRGESTPAAVSEFMAKMKFISDRIVLKVRSLEVSPEHPLKVALGQLAKAEQQLGEVVK